MADFRVPLESVNPFTGAGNSLNFADPGTGKERKSFREPADLICMRCPNRDLIRVPCENSIMFPDGHFDRSISPVFSWPNVTAKFPGYNMQPEADPQYRDPKIKILRTYTCTRDIRPAAKDNTPVSRGNFLLGRRIRDQGYFDLQVPEGTVDQVIKLAVIIDHTDGKHCHKFIG
jgi:hypothetical protein